MMPRPPVILLKAPGSQVEQAFISVSQFRGHKSANSYTQECILWGLLNVLKYRKVTYKSPDFQCSVQKK